MPRPTCNLEGCDRAARKNSMYCSDRHRKEFARRRYEERKAAQNQQEVYLEQEKRKLERLELQSSLRQLARAEVKRQTYIDAIKQSLSPFEPTPAQQLTLPQEGPHTDVDWVICLSDWHVGQRTPIETTGSIYEQTLDITKRQVDKLLAAISSIFYEAEGKRVRRIWLPVLGDIVEGDHLRPAQLTEIEIPVVKQTVEATDLLAYFIRSLLSLPGVEEIVVDVVGGNHDRSTTKAGNAGLAEAFYVDSFAWLIGTILQRMFEHDDRVSITNHESFFGMREFGGLRHVFEHGSSIRISGSSYGGIPFYGIHNAARHWESYLGGVDMVWFGHLHIPYRLPLGQQGYIVGNGALPATSRFIQSRYKTIRRPQQWLVEIHRDIGATAFRDLYADINLMKPGEIWEVIKE